MTYKAIIKNMIELKAVRKAEKLMEENGIKLDWTSTDEDKIEMDNTEKSILPFDVTFEVVKVGAPRKTVKLHGYIDEWGGVNICALWKCGKDEWHNELVWTCIEDVADNWELLR